MICIVDERLPREAEETLLSLGYRVIRLPRALGLSEAVSSHPDMLLFFEGRTLISSAEYCDAAIDAFAEISSLTEGLEVRLTADVFTEKYPHDAIFNALVMGDKIFLKEDSVSRAVLQYAKERGLYIYPVKQGYPACTTMKLSDSAAVTADRGMARALSDAGISVTLIENGGILLPPHEYGFIGGASGRDGNFVYFIGDILTHPDSDAIISAIKAEKLTPVSLYQGPLLDLGGLIFIKEDTDGRY